MLQLERFTTEYVEHEDRIRLRAQGAQGDVMALWLTQRLLARLVPHCCQWLEAKSSEVPAAMLGRLAGVHQSFAQQAAQLALQQNPCPAVPLPDGAGAAQVPAVLVFAIDVTQGDGQLVLGFKDGAGQLQALVPLAAQALRQWLGIVYDQSCKAEWPAHIWPLWLQDAMSPSAPVRSSPALLH